MFVNDLFKNNKMTEGFDELEAYMKSKLAPKPRGGAGVKQGTYGQPDRRRGRPAVATGGQGSSVPQAVDFDRPHSERSAGRRLPRYSDDHDANFRREVDEGSVQDRLHRRHQELRKKSGLPDPEYYKELKASYDIENDQKRIAQQAEIKKKYKVAEANVKKPQPYNKPGWWKELSKNELEALAGPRDNKYEKKKQDNTGKKQGVAEGSDNRQWSNKEKETFRRNVAGLDDMFGKDDAWTKTKQRQIKHQIKTKPMAGPKGQLPEQQGVTEGVERYLEEMRRAGYDIVTEAATLCPECGGLAYEDKMLAEKQDACYHKVKSRYKVWPSAYASGALVRCRKVGAKNWGNKSKE